MIIKETPLKGCVILQPDAYKDKRGYFMESFNQKSFNDVIDHKGVFVQDNESKSSRGVLRGLHFQKGIYAQAKLVRVVMGSVQDVVVDIRPQSPTFGEYFSIELSANNKLQLFIPRGFAHGFLVLEEDTIFSYKCDNYYNPENESGILYNDPDLAIEWKISEKELIISDKDRRLPVFKNCKI